MENYGFGDVISGSPEVSMIGKMLPEYDFEINRKKCKDLNVLVDGIYPL